ncbi:MAG: double-strand break repair protein AddB, partial [Alphaproteobacteria bacterium]
RLVLRALALLVVPALLAALVAGPFAEGLDGFILRAGDALAGFLSDLTIALPLYDQSLAGGELRPFLEVLMQGRAVRPRRSNHPRLSILGPLEARMMSADLTILGGLNEGVWPRAAPTDPWLSRPMRSAIGLPEPERALGLSAHDFVQALSRGEVILSRAEKQDDAPAVASRWLTRFETVLKTFTGNDDAVLPQGPWVDWVKATNDFGGGNPVQAPRPTPPVEARPMGLSVTQVEKLIRDPYAIYARHVLKLKALDPLDQEPGAAERGQIVHAALEEFVRRYPQNLPQDKADAFEALLDIGSDLFDTQADRPSIRAFWWPRFEQMAGWFIDYEYDRRGGMARAHVELDGVYKFETKLGLFALRARADRVDQLADGRLAILDYKTGGVPSDKEVGVGFAPQLPLEAAIAERGGFKGLGAAQVAELAYIQLTGRDAGGKARAIKANPSEIGEAALQGLQDLIALYANPAQPYLSRPHVKYRKDYSDYDHLARLGEWQNGEGEEI